MVHRMCYNHYIIDERKVHNMKLSVQNWEIIPDSDGMGMLNVFSEEGDIEFPLLIRTFDIPEDAVPENAELDIDVILYPESLRIFRDEEEYRQKSGSHRAAESVIPSGCFPPRPDPNFVKSNTALINGRILSLGDSDQEGIFKYMELECLGLVLDVIVENHLADTFRNAQPGNIVCGRFFIEGYGA